jgi:hypothetical protein
MYLGYNIMRSHFGGWSEKGIYCCATCTLSVLPLYRTGAFEAFDRGLLRQNVLKAMADRTGPFAAKSVSPRYAEWAMRFAWDRAAAMGLRARFTSRLPSAVATPRTGGPARSAARPPARGRPAGRDA